MFLSSFAITVFALVVILGNDPWYAPQYAIPLLGMLLGNTMNGIAISMDRLTHAAWEQRHIIEARLMLGQTADEAISEYRRQAVRSGMIPIINAMAAAGQPAGHDDRPDTGRRITGRCSEIPDPDYVSYFSRDRTGHTGSCQYWSEAPV